MAKHKLHRPSTHKSSTLYTTCLLRTRITPPIPYPTIATHLLTTAPEICQKLAKKSAPRDLRPRLSKDEDELKKWLEGFLEESYKQAEEMESVSWLKARDCGGGVVMECFRELGLGEGDRGYEVLGIERAERGARVYTSSYDEKCMNWRKRSGGSVNEDIPELVDIGVSGRLSEREPDYLRILQSEGPRMIKEIRAHLAEARAQAQNHALALVNERLESWTKTKEYEDRNITGDLKIELGHDRGQSESSNMTYRTISGPTSPIIDVPAAQKRTTYTETEGTLEANQQKEHQERTNDILRRLKAVQQKYGGNFDSKFATQPWPLPLLGSCYSQLPRIRERFDHQLAVTASLEQLHPEENSDAGNLYISSWLATIHV